MNTKTLSYLTLASLISALLGILFNGLEFALCGIAVSAFVLQIAATDYAPRRFHGRAARVCAGTRERLPYAA